MNTPGRQVATREERPPVKVDLLKPISDLDEALRLSDALALSTLVPDSLRGKPASILHVILTGQALDLHWTEAIRVIYSPGNGQVGMRAQFLLSQLRKAGHKYSAEYSEDGQSCTFTLIRKDEPDNPYTATFSRQDAIDAKLISKDNWTRYFKRMLRARAITDCVGFGAPEVLLGFVVEGDEPEAPPVQLKPSAPAPPSPAEAATSEAAGQADQLRELDERMQGPRPETMTQPVSFDDTPESPAMGGNLPDEPIGVTLAREADEAEAVAEAELATAPTVPDAEAPTAPSASASPDEPVDASGKAKDVVLSEWFTAFGYDPKQYPEQVLHICSVFTRRRITGARAMKAAEVMKLTNELSALYRRTDELAPVSRLADASAAWAEAWRAEDPEGFSAYEESK
jgi:hypothetical protein